MLKDLGDNKISITTSNGAEIVGDFRYNKSNKGLIIVNGFTEERAVANFLARHYKKHFKTWNFDLNSQGESTGNWNLEEMVESFKEVQQVIKHNYGLDKLGMHGNSTGGIVTGLIANSENNLDAICLTGAPAALQDAFPHRLRSLLKRLPNSLIMWGAIKIYKWLSTQNGGEQEGDRVKKEKDHLKLGSAKLYDIKKTIQGVDIATRLDENTQNINLPALIIYGGEDKTCGFKKGVAPHNITQMYDAIKSAEKELKIYPGLNHRLYTSPQPTKNLPPKYHLVTDHLLAFFKKYLA